MSLKRVLVGIFLSIVALSLITIASSIAYYHVVYLPRVLEFKKEQKVALENCIEEALELYDYDWNGNCKLRNMEDQCVLEPDLAIMINTRRDDLKRECFRLYPQSSS